MCGGKLKGAEIGSKEIEFIPGKIRGGRYLADTKTAGSISLLLQVALPCALLADTTVVLDMKGGTNTDNSPHIDYIDKVFKKMLNNFGADFQLDIIKRGYSPKGGGHVRATVNPVRSLRGADITHRGDVLSVKGYSFVAGTLPIKMAYEMAEGAKRALSSIPRVDIHCYKEDQEKAPDSCAGIILQCDLSSDCVLGSDMLVNNGLDSANVGEMAGKALQEIIDSGATVDTYVQDQLIIFMALAEGRSAIRTSEVTLHTRAAIDVVEAITKIEFNLRSDGNKNIIIECTGLGYINSNIINTNSCKN